MTSQRILLAGGITLFLASALSGLYYDIFLRAELHTAVSYNLDMALNMATKGDLTMASAFAGEFASQSLLNEIQSRLPVHLALAGAAAIAPATFIASLDMSERMKRVLACLIIGSGFLLGTGDVLQLLGRGWLGQYIVLGGYAWLMLGLTGFGLYGVLAVWLNAKPHPKRR